MGCQRGMAVRSHVAGEGLETVDEMAAADSWISNDEGSIIEPVPNLMVLVSRGSAAGVEV